MVDTVDDVQMREKFRRLETLIREAEKNANPETRARVNEVVQLLMDLHGAGLERMMGRIAATGNAGAALIESFAKDSLLASLLLLYGLHPLNLETRVGQALDKARPTLHAHGGNVELLNIDEGVVRLRLTGSCHGCPSSAVTLRQTIEEAVLEFAPDAAGIEVLGEDDAPVAIAVDVESTPVNAAGRLAASDSFSMNEQASNPLATLRRLARREPSQEKCELCGKPIGPGHQHLFEPTTRRLICSCDACSFLFPGQSNARFVKVPRRIERYPEFQMSDEQWESLHLPINLAFFYRNSPTNRVIAMFPGPAGATESLLTFDAWQDLTSANPVLLEFEPDVEALLVNRVGHLREYCRVPIDECFKLVGLIRTHWHGLSGGTEVWVQINKFFAGIKQRSSSATGESIA